MEPILLVKSEKAEKNMIIIKGKENNKKDIKIIKIFFIKRIK